MYRLQAKGGPSLHRNKLTDMSKANRLLILNTKRLINFMDRKCLYLCVTQSMTKLLYPLQRHKKAWDIKECYGIKLKYCKERKIITNSNWQK